MSLRTGVVTVIAVLCLGTFAILMLIVPSSSPQSRTTSSSIRQLQSTLDKQIEIPNSLDQRKLPSSLDTQREILTSLKDQRDDLSRQLNELRQKMGRIDCEVSSMNRFYGKYTSIESVHVPADFVLNFSLCAGSKCLVSCSVLVVNLVNESSWQTNK